MATVKVTFTLDAQTIQRLENVADRLAIPKSEVVREAITEVHDRLGRLSERERTTLLKTFDKVIARIEPRDLKEVDQELAQVRQARKAGGRRANFGSNACSL
jgi:Arc/MetJ-type ribon-helix-helix transcriptional regulator